MSKPALVKDVEMKESHLQESATVKDDAVEETFGCDFEGEWWAKHGDAVNEICKAYDKK